MCSKSNTLYDFYSNTDTIENCRKHGRISHFDICIETGIHLLKVYMTNLLSFFLGNGNNLRDGAHPFRQDPLMAYLDSVGSFTSFYFKVKTSTSVGSPQSPIFIYSIFSYLYLFAINFIGIILVNKHKVEPTEVMLQSGTPEVYII